MTVQVDQGQEVETQGWSYPGQKSSTEQQGVAVRLVVACQVVVVQYPNLTGFNNQFTYNSVHKIFLCLP